VNGEKILIYLKSIDRLIRAQVWWPWRLV